MTVKELFTTVGFDAIVKALQNCLCLEKVDS